MKIEVVEWNDASFDKGPVHVDDVDSDYKCRTIGQVIKESKDHLVIASEKISDGRYRDVYSIPKGMIIFRKSVELKNWKGSIK